MDLIRPIIQYRLGFERATVAKLITECGKLMTALFIKFLTKQRCCLRLIFVKWPHHKTESNWIYLGLLKLQVTKRWRSLDVVLQRAKSSVGELGNDTAQTVQKNSNQKNTSGLLGNHPNYEDAWWKDMTHSWSTSRYKFWYKKLKNVAVVCLVAYNRFLWWFFMMKWWNICERDESMNTCFLLCNKTKAIGLCLMDLLLIKQKN